jgi:ribosomal protein S18 acetylase RimI-like enzyme
VLCGNDGHRGWVYYVAVSPDRQRENLGRAIMAHAESWLRELGVAKVELMIRESNDAVARFYESLGYETEPRIIMSRWLKPPPARPDD